MANLIRVTILVDKAKKKELKMEALRNDLSLSRFLIMCADLVLKCPDCVKKLQEKPEEKKQE